VSTLLDTLGGVQFGRRAIAALPRSAVIQPLNEASLQLPIDSL
jgi:hypothetical protein